MEIKKSFFNLCAGAIITILLSCAPQSLYAKKSRPEVSPTRGKILWANTCSRCHSLPSPDKLSKKHWHVSIAHMRVRAQLTGEEAQDILAFLTGNDPSDEDKKLNLPTPIPPEKNGNSYVQTSTKTSGSSIYNDHCSVCHGSSTKPGIPGAPSLHDANVLLAKSVSDILEIVKQGKGAMPPRGGNPQLTDNELKAAIEYMRSVASKK